VQDLFTYKDNPRERSGNNQRTVWRQGYFGMIKSVVRSRSGTRSWTAPPSRSTTSRSKNAWRHWAMGLAYSANGQPDKAKATLAEMHKDLDAVTSAKEPSASRRRSSKRRSRRAVGIRRRPTSYRKLPPIAKRTSCTRTARLSAAGG
jgi:hypothetical protein